MKFWIGALGLLAASAFGQVQSEQKLFASAPAGFDLYGGSLAIDNTRLVVGAGGVDSAGPDAGLAYVYFRSATGWVEEATLAGSTLAAGDQFGAVAIDGDTIAVGAWRDDTLCGPGCDSGAVYVFVRQGSSWVEQAKLLASDADPGDRFGEVALDGDRLAVGACLADGSNPFAPDSGAVYIFERSGTSWTETAILSPIDHEPDDRFGAVALDGDILAVGACKEDDGCPPGFPDCDTGAVYIYEHDGVSWSETAKLLASDGAGEDGFGESLALRDGVLLVGACMNDEPAPGTGLDSGAAYVFRKTGATWSEETILRPSDAVPGDRFGFSVALDGHRLVIGATNQDAPARNQGAVYVYEYDGLDWVEVEKLIAFDGETENVFGSSVAIEGRTIASGAVFDDHPPSMSLFAGSVYVYDYLSDLRAYCFGDGGDQMGCTPCPCGNEAPPGTLGGCIHSAGGSARLYVEGSPRISFDTLRFEMEGALPSSFGILISGNGQPPAMSPVCSPGAGITSAFLDGLRCVNASVVRHGARATDSNGDTGITSPGWGPPNGPPPGLIAQVGFPAGLTRHFQVFFRELEAAVCATGQNTSNGVSVTMLP